MADRPILFDHIASADARECAALLAAIAARLAMLTPDVTVPVEPSDELIDAQEVSRILKVSVRTVQARAGEAPLKAARVTSLGRGLLFSRAKVLRLIEREAGRDGDVLDIGLRGVNSGRRKRQQGGLGINVS